MATIKMITDRVTKEDNKYVFIIFSFPFVFLNSQTGNRIIKKKLINNKKTK